MNKLFLNGAFYLIKALSIPLNVLVMGYFLDGSSQSMILVSSSIIAIIYLFDFGYVSFLMRSASLNGSEDFKDSVLAVNIFAGTIIATVFGFWIIEVTSSDLTDKVSYVVSLTITAGINYYLFLISTRTELDTELRLRVFKTRAIGVFFGGLAMLAVTAFGGIYGLQAYFITQALILALTLRRTTEFKLQKVKFERRLYTLAPIWITGFFYWQSLNLLSNEFLPEEQYVVYGKYLVLVNGLLVIGNAVFTTFKSEIIQIKLGRLETLESKNIYLVLIILLALVVVFALAPLVYSRLVFDLFKPSLFVLFAISFLYIQYLVSTLLMFYIRVYEVNVATKTTLLLNICLPLLLFILLRNASYDYAIFVYAVMHSIVPLIYYTKLNSVLFR